MINKKPNIKNGTYCFFNDIINVKNFDQNDINIHDFFYKKHFYKKISLENPKTLRKYLENLQPQMPELEFLTTLVFARALAKL